MGLGADSQAPATVAAWLQQHPRESSSLSQVLCYWNLSEPHSSGCQLPAHCFAASFEASFSISHLQSLCYRKKKRKNNSCFRETSPSESIQDASATQPSVLPSLVPNKPELVAPAVSINLTNVSAGPLLTSSHFFQWDTKKDQFSVNVRHLEAFKSPEND